MGHSEDDAVHKIPYKMKTHWQNQLKISVLFGYKILYRIRYKKINVILVQCPFNAQALEANGFDKHHTSAYVLLFLASFRARSKHDRKKIVSVSL